jgi:hypothetical protein
MSGGLWMLYSKMQPQLVNGKVLLVCWWLSHRVCVMRESVVVVV